MKKTVNYLRVMYHLAKMESYFQHHAVTSEPKHRQEFRYHVAKVREIVDNLYFLKEK